MSPGGISDVLTERAALAGVELAEPLSSELASYFDLLARWNRTINLTSLSDPAEAVDRLLLEPVAAAAHLPRGPALIDLGSGGGSPAIPLALTLGASRLVMVESRTRKAAFLREAMRALGLTGTVEAARFEDVSTRADFMGSFSVVSVRAVRPDESLFAAIQALLRVGGQAALFRSLAAGDSSFSGLPSSLRWLSDHELIRTSRSSLTLFQRV